MQIILTPADAISLARFMNFIDSNIAREVGKLHDWESKFWQRRYKAIPILDDDTLVARMRYNLAHGCKEGLVWRPRDWPGVSSLSALASGKKITGVWIDRTAMSKASGNSTTLDPRDFATTYEVPIEPIPALQDLPDEEQQKFYRKMVADIERETRQNNRDKGHIPPGPAWVCRQHPHTILKGGKNTPAPLCLTRSRRIRMAFFEAYKLFLHAFRQAAQRLKAGELDVDFPPNCFPPGLPFVPFPRALPP